MDDMEKPITIQWHPTMNRFLLTFENGHNQFRNLLWCQHYLDKETKHNWDEIKNHPEQIYRV